MQLRRTDTDPDSKPCSKRVGFSTAFRFALAHSEFDPDEYATAAVPDADPNSHTGNADCYAGACLSDGYLSGQRRANTRRSDHVSLAGMVNVFR
jgi:hypothetical protein